MNATVEEPTFEAASVVNETGRLDCSEPNGDRVVPGGTVVYQCRFEALSGLSLSTEFVATMNTSGWDVSISDGVLGASPLNGDGTARITSTLVSNLIANLTVTVRAPVGATPGTSANVGITVRTCSVLWVGTSCVFPAVVSTVGTATVQTTVVTTAPVTNAFGVLGVDVASLACYPASASGTFGITQGGELQITCSLHTLLSASLISGGAQLGFSTITSTFPASWGVSYVINGQSYSALSGVALGLGSLDLLALSTNGVFSFSVL